MRIVLAPDSFKESMTAIEVADAIERGIRNVCEVCDIVKIPLADGGEGTAEIVMEHLGAERVEAEVTGPLGEPLVARYGIVDGEMAIIDVVSVIGMQFVPEEMRNPLVTTTFGIGELLIDALNRGVRKFFIGLGGSSTNDGGIGMVQALGAEFLNRDGEAVARGGAGLEELAHISLKELDERLGDCSFTVASDVNNLLLGESGATYVFGPQKGADDAMLESLELGMENYAAILKRDLACDVTHVAGAGAAGGLGAAFHAFLQADIRRGIDYIMEITNLEDEIAQATLLITGEGKIDEQSLYGKVPFGVAQLAKKYAVPVLAIVGAKEVSSDSLYEAGIGAVFPIVKGPMSLEEALSQAEALTEGIVENVFRLLETGIYRDRNS